MAKHKTSGPVRYHNLAGLMRDLRKALDNGDQEAYEFAELLIECDELIGDGGGEDAEDGIDDPADGDSLAVASNVADVREEMHARPRGPASRSEARGTPASLLDRALDSLAGDERSEAQRELDVLRMHSMGAPRVAAPKGGPRGTPKAK